MRRYTTPVHTLMVEGVDLTNADVWVTYENSRKRFTVKAASVSYSNKTTTIKVSLTEKQTASLSSGNARVQVNWTLGGRRYATNVETVKVEENLLEEELL